MIGYTTTITGTALAPIDQQQQQTPLASSQPPYPKAMVALHQHYSCVPAIRINRKQSLSSPSSFESIECSFAFADGAFSQFEYLNPVKWFFLCRVVHIVPEMAYWTSHVVLIEMGFIILLEVIQPEFWWLCRPVVVSSLSLDKCFASISRFLTCVSKIHKTFRSILYRVFGCFDNRYILFLFLRLFFFFLSK